MPIVAPVRPMPICGERDRPPNLAGLLFGILIAIPLWAVILAFIV